MFDYVKILRIQINTYVIQGQHLKGQYLHKQWLSFLFLYLTYVYRIKFMAPRWVVLMRTHTLTLSSVALTSACVSHATSSAVMSVTWLRTFWTAWRPSSYCCHNLINSPWWWIFSPIKACRFSNSFSTSFIFSWTEACLEWSAAMSCRPTSLNVSISFELLSTSCCVCWKYLSKFR